MYYLGPTVTDSVTYFVCGVAKMSCSPSVEVSVYIRPAACLLRCRTLVTARPSRPIAATQP